MKKVLLLTFTAFAVLFFSGCQKNNYVTGIPAPHFTYVKADTKSIKKVEADSQQEKLTNEPSFKESEEKEPDFLVSSENSAPTNNVSLSQSAVSQQAITKLNKEVTSNAISGKKLTFKERLVTKAISKRIAKAQNSGKPNSERPNTIALISGIAGLLGIVLLFTSAGALSILLALGAIIMGFVGRSQIRRSGESGNGWAITGIVSGILIFFILLLAVIFIASLLAF